MGTVLSNEPRTPKPVVDPRLPRFPVIEDKPTFSQIQEAIRPRDFVSFATVVSLSMLGGRFIPDKSMSIVFRQRFFAGATAAGALLGTMMVHDFGEARLRGFAENELEVIKFKGEASTKQAEPAEAHEA
ncbi:hypothetical protein AC1031_015643 [Aphanomyces cochlioides]|nr:hypothetical protein AC1031_015643 [Aphanomyces cochlioides]